jgi:hypothetical protein
LVRLSSEPVFFVPFFDDGRLSFLLGFVHILWSTTTANIPELNVYLSYSGSFPGFLCIVLTRKLNSTEPEIRLTVSFSSQKL